MASDRRAPGSGTRVRASVVRDLVVGLVATALCWPVRDGTPAVGLDPGWRWFITRAAREHLRFGHDVVFTYGPLGWLFEPVAPSSGQLVAATVFAAVVFVGGFAVLTRLLAARLPRAVAVVLVVAASSQLQVPAAELTAALLTCVVLARLLLGTRPVGLGTVAVVAVAAGALTTTKIGIGLVLGAQAALLAVVAGRGPQAGRHPGTVARGFGTVARGVGTVARGVGTAVLVGVAGIVVGFLVAWLGAGQRLRDVSVFLRGSQQVQAGYQSAMSYEEPGRTWEWTAAAVGLTLLVAVVALAAAAAAPTDRFRVVAAGAAALGAVYNEVLQAFVRHGGTHDVAGQEAAVVVVAGLIGGLGAIPVRSPRGAGRPSRAVPRRRPVILGLAAATPALAAVVWVGACAVAARDVAVPAIGQDRVRWLLTDLRLSGDPSARRAVEAAGLATVRDTAAIPSGVRAALGAGPVTPVPWELTAVTASGLDLSTLPVPQTYGAYTPYLDELNADVLRSPTGPPTVLRQYARAIDQRNPMWESPQAMLVLVCHYREVAVGGGYQVLRRAAPSCAVGPEVLGTARVEPGSTVPVGIPAPRRSGDGVVMSLELDWGPVDQVRRRVVRQPGTVYVGGGSRPFRLVPDTVGGPLVLLVPRGVWSARTTTTQQQRELVFTAPVTVTVTFRELERTD